MIKCWLVRDMDAVYHVPIWALLTPQKLEKTKRNSHYQQLEKRKSPSQSFVWFLPRKIKRSTQLPSKEQNYPRKEIEERNTEKIVAAGKSKAIEELQIRKLEKASDQKPISFQSARKLRFSPLLSSSHESKRHFPSFLSYIPRQLPPREMKLEKKRRGESIKRSKREESDLNGFDGGFVQTLQALLNLELRGRRRRRSSASHGEDSEGPKGTGDHGQRSRLSPPEREPASPAVHGLERKSRRPQRAQKEI